MKIKQILIVELNKNDRTVIELEKKLDLEEFSFKDGASFKKYYSINNYYLFYKRMKKSIGKAKMKRIEKCEAIVYQVLTI